MDFWDTFWATMWGALGGAVVGAFVAWLFSLDLKRRERDDRKQEREQDQLDRVAEREQDRLSREAEREQDRQARLVERDTEREAEYADRIRHEWPRVIDVMRDYGNAGRAIYDARRTDQKIGDGFKVYQHAVVAFNQRLLEVATMARGVDHELIGLIGTLAMTGVPYTAEHIQSLDKANQGLIIYTATPATNATAQASLLVKLRDLVAQARIDAKTLLAEGMQ